MVRIPCIFVNRTLFTFVFFERTRQGIDAFQQCAIKLDDLRLLSIRRRIIVAADVQCISKLRAYSAFARLAEWRLGAIDHRHHH